MNGIVDAARKIRELQAEQNQQRPGESDEDFERRSFDALDLEYEWIGGIAYKGNSVSWIKSKADANGRALMDAWEALIEIGGICDGKTRLADAIRKLKR
jgi:hypothetical protein